LKTLKKYEVIDKLISKAALTKFSQHLWYLCDEIAVFDDEVDDQVKMKMVSNLECEKSFDVGKRYMYSI
jgi:tellurite resistance protein